MHVKDQWVYRSWLFLKIALGITGFLYGCTLIATNIMSFVDNPSDGYFNLNVAFRAIFIPCVVFLTPSLLLLISKNKYIITTISYVTTILFALLSIGTIANIIRLTPSITLKKVSLALNPVSITLLTAATTLALAWLTSAIFQAASKNKTLKDQLVYRSWLLLKISLGLFFVLEGLSRKAASSKSLIDYFIGLPFYSLIFIILGLGLLILQRKKSLTAFLYAVAIASSIEILFGALFVAGLAISIGSIGLKLLNMLFVGFSMSYVMPIPIAAIALILLTEAVYNSHEPTRHNVPD